MVYISGGQVVARRGVCRLSIITDFIWSVLNVVFIFVQSLCGCKRAAGKEDRIQGFGGGRSGHGGGGGGGGGGGFGKRPPPGAGPASKPPASNVRGISDCAARGGG